MLSRLDELQPHNESVANEYLDPSIDFDVEEECTIEIMKQSDSVFGSLNSKINHIKTVTANINELISIKRRSLPKQQKEALCEVNTIIAETTSLMNQIQHTLNEENIKNKSEMNSLKKTWNNNMLNTNMMHYQSAISEFQESAHQFQTIIHGDFARQAKIINPDISEIELNKMLKSRDPFEYLEEHLMKERKTVTKLKHNLNDKLLKGTQKVRLYLVSTEPISFQPILKSKLY
eukprot:UN03538